MSVEALRDRIDSISREQREIEKRARALTRERTEVEAMLAQAARAEMSLRPIDAGPHRTRTQQHCSIEHVRDTIVTLGRFVISELAAELGVTSAAARRLLDDPDIAKIVQPAGHIGRRIQYAYVASTGPGAAFEAQQRLRLVSSEATADLAMAGTGEAAANVLDSIRDKDVRKVVAEAIREGWVPVAVARGPHPFKLTRGTETIPIATNSAHAAKAIRRRLRHAS